MTEDMTEQTKENVNKEEAQSNENLVPLHDENGNFAKGHKKVGGRVKGVKNFNTIFDDAIREIANSGELKIKDPEKNLMVRAIAEALKGNYNFWKALAEWRYGKVPNYLDITSGGISLVKPSPEDEEIALKALEDIDD